MAGLYTYTNSPDYIKQLKFDYIETYSFQRGSEFEAYHAADTKEYFALQARKAKHVLTGEQEERYKLLKILNTTQYLIGADGGFHPSSIKTHTFKRTENKVDELMGILSIEPVDVPAWLCAPVYRDAIVFYDSDRRIISTLNICLGCQYMGTRLFSEINADAKVYVLLKKFFAELGHEIEDR